MLENFWKLDQTVMKPEEIIEKAKEFYAEDFIENYEFWKVCIKEINDYVIVMLGNVGIDAEHFVPITFDGFCTKIIDDIARVIEKHGNLVTQDTQDILRDLGNGLYHNTLATYEDKRGSISQMRESIKKIVLL